MDDYDCIKKSSLKFKGEKKKKKKKSHRSDKDRTTDRGETSTGQQLDERKEDAESHGGWWKVTQFEHIKDDVCLEFIPGCYAHALGNGKVVLGKPHAPGDGPDEEEIFTAICAGTNHIALKSGFGRYLSVDGKKRLMGLSEAIGELETFLPVFEDGKMALCAHNECFLAPNPDTEPPLIVAKSQKAGPSEIINIRINNDPLMFSKQKDRGQGQFDDVGKILETELSHLKKTSRNVSVDEEKRRLKKARVDGQLYEALLDTRVKHKSDKYCK